MQRLIPLLENLKQIKGFIQDVFNTTIRFILTLTIGWAIGELFHWEFASWWRMGASLFLYITAVDSARSTRRLAGRVLLTEDEAHRIPHLSERKPEV